MIKDLPASVRQRLTNKAHATKRPFQEVLQYFAMERFLYRLSTSAHADRFVLKGAPLAAGAPAVGLSACPASYAPYAQPAWFSKVSGLGIGTCS